MKIRKTESIFQENDPKFRKTTSYFRKNDLRFRKNEVKFRGVAITRIRKVTNAIAFIHQYTTEPPGLHTNWVSEGTSLGSYTFRGLNSDKRHWFRVVAIGYHGLRSYSPIVSWVIQ